MTQQSSHVSADSETYYSHGLEAPLRPTLSGTHRFDAVVVGAGYAGISAALAFLAEGRSVLVLEQEHVAAGASGRNGGILLLTEGTHLGDPDESRRAADTLGAAAHELVQLIDEHRIDADVRRGSIRLAITRRQARHLARSAAAGRRQVSSGGTFLDRDALRAHIRSDRYTGGLLEHDNLSLNPRRLLEGLTVLAESRGAVVAERSPVRRCHVEPHGTARVQTDHADVTAGRLVVAAGVGTGELVPRAGRLLLTGYSQIAVTEPVPEGDLDRLLPSWAAASEIATFSRYFRRLPGGRLLFGISSVLHPIAPKLLEAQIRAELRDTFPALGDVPFDSVWEGQIASTRHETPLLERIGSTAVVTSSNGVLPSWNAGRTAARATDPVFEAYDRLRRNRHRPWPPLGLPESLVRCGARSVLRFKDRL